MMVVVVGRALMTTAIEYGAASLIIGDPRIYGRCYVGTNGFGMVYGDLVGSGQ